VYVLKRIGGIEDHRNIKQGCEFIGEIFDMPVVGHSFYFLHGDARTMRTSIVEDWFMNGKKTIIKTMNSTYELTPIETRGLQ
jgi:hypothetical protein